MSSGVGLPTQKLVCIDISEYALYTLQQEFSQGQLDTKILYIVADVKNKTRMNHVLLTHQPKLVLHAAAYKHVPLMEDFNVTEALLNNAFGTYQFASACQTAQVEKFVLISTDKAVNPTNVMGASKRLAELVCQSLQPKNKPKLLLKHSLLPCVLATCWGAAAASFPSSVSRLPMVVQ